MAGGRPSILTAEMVIHAAEVARKAPTLRAIGHALGVRPGTVRDWIRKGERPDGPPLHAEFAAAIHGALAEAEMALVVRIAGGEPRDCAWLLTHSPFFRDDWSDAAAERRSERRILAAVVEAIAAAGLPAEQERTVLLTMQARGLGGSLDSEAVA
jgi:hypothetical protein